MFTKLLSDFYSVALLLLPLDLVLFEEKANCVGEEFYFEKLFSETQRWNSFTSRITQQYFKTIII